MNLEHTMLSKISQTQKDRCGKVGHLEESDSWRWAGGGRDGELLLMRTELLSQLMEKFERWTAVMVVQH